jgi:hypothetical protein
MLQLFRGNASVGRTHLIAQWIDREDAFALTLARTI